MNESISTVTESNNSYPIFYSKDDNILMEHIFNNVPEVALKIFSNLDWKSLLKLSEVCKSWKVLAEDKFLWKAIILRHGLQFEILNNGGQFNRSQFVQIQMKREDLYKSIEGKYGISLAETQTSTFCTDENMKTVFACDYLNPAAQPDSSAPMQFTYKEGFDFVINRINLLIRRQKSFLLRELEKTNAESITKKCLLRLDAESVTMCNLTNIEHQKTDGIESLKCHSFVSWYSVICHVLQEQGLIKCSGNLTYPIFVESEIRVLRGKTLN